MMGWLLMLNDENQKIIKINPVVLYLEDLFWIESKLIEFSLKGRVTFNTPNSHYEVDYISEMIKISEILETTRIHNLHFDYSGVSVHFDEYKTYIRYGRKAIERILEKLISNYLNKKRNKHPYNKSKIFLQNKPEVKSFWLQDKTPLWLSVLLALIPIIISVIALLK